MNQSICRNTSDVRQGGLFTGITRYLLLPLLLSVALAACDPGFKVEEADFGSTTTTTTTQVPKFLYAVNNGSSSVSGFSINLSTGALTPVPGSPFTVGATSRDVAVDPSGTHLYVTSEISASYSVFTIDPSTGNLTPIAGSPFTLANNPWGIRVHPSGNYVYVATRLAATIIRFVRNPSTGALSSPLTLTGQGTDLARIEIHPSKNFLYVADFAGAGAGVRSYSINDADGLMTFTGSVSTAALSIPFAVTQALAIDSSGSYLYLGHRDTPSAIAAYSIDQSTGVLTSISPDVYTTGSGPAGIGFDSTGTWLYTANFFDATITGLSLNSADGSLTPLGGSPYTTSGTDPIYIKAAGSYVYTAEFAAGTVSGFSIDGTTGNLTPTAQGTIFSGSNPFALEIVFGDP